MGVPVRRNTKSSHHSKSSQSRELSAEDYFMEAEMAYCTDDIEGARMAFKRALDLEPENIMYLDGYGTFLAENGPREDSIVILQRACELAPDHGFEKFMYLGQVLDAEDRTQEAERSMRRGIELLRQEIAQMEDHPELAGSGGDEAAEELADAREHLREALSSALCSLAELLMGSAADEADEADEEGDAFQELLAASPALRECENLLQEAQCLWSRSPEPLQALSSLRHLQGQDDLALELLRQSLSLWHIPLPPGGEEKIENGGDGTNEVNMVEEAGASAEISGTLPSYEFRFETAKLLVELDDSMETAASVLEGLLEENDTVPDVWLLLAVAYRSGGELEAAAEAASEGASMARKLGLPADHEVVAALGELETELSHMVVHTAVGAD